MLDSTELIRELVAIPGPPGQEGAVREAVAAHVTALGYEHTTDGKGNLLVRVGRGRVDPPHAVVTAHMDELALMVTRIDESGRIRVQSMGGLYPWKWGEQPVLILAAPEPVPAIGSFGCIHTDSPASVAHQARNGPLGWEHAFLFTGRSRGELRAMGVRPGTRVVMHPSRRTVETVGHCLCSYFLDDRADLAAWLLALEVLRENPPEAGVVFAATAAEEVGGEGAAFLLHRLQPDICVALEIGPSVPESPFMLDWRPTVWVTDSYSSIMAQDMDLLATVCEELGVDPHWQALSRGGSDASIASQHGTAARPITLGLPLENSHGFEIMHREAPRELARLLVAYLSRSAEARS